MLRGLMVPAMLALATTAMAAPVAVFDKPIDTKVAALPPDPANPQAAVKPKRTCTYYSGFVEKEVDLGEVGAAEQTVTQIPKGTKAPACDAKIKSEIRVEDEWSYFLGVKGTFLFFYGPDGVNGGLPFLVASASTGKKLFQDSLRGNHFAAVQIENGALVLRYRRAIDMRCSMAADAAACWRRVNQETALPQTARSDCETSFKKEIAQQKIPAADLPRLGTMIGYNVEARYAHGKLAFMPRPGAVTCWLED